MGSLFHPIGSQPAWVYWARRGALVLAVLAVIAALIFVFRPQPEAPVAGIPVVPSVTPEVTPSTTPSVTGTPSPSPTPTGPLACDATNTSLALAGYQKVKQDGKQLFTLSLTNTGSETCLLTFSPSVFTLTVTSGTDRIWSTDDCAKWVPTQKGKLKAGKAFEFTVNWSVARSSAGCKLSKATLGTGTYVAAAAFDTNAKARQVFQVVKA